MYKWLSSIVSSQSEMICDRKETASQDTKPTVNIGGPGVFNVDPAEIIRSKSADKQFAAVESLVAKGAFKD